MNCRKLQDLVPDYLKGQLSPDNRRELETHLTDCESCRSNLASLASVWGELGGMPAAQTSQELRSRFYAMLEAEKRRLRQRESESWLRRFDGWLAAWWPRRPAVQVGLAAALLVGGLAAGSGIGGARKPDGTIAELRDEVQQLHQMVCLSLLDQESSSERLKGVNWSTRVIEPSVTLLASLEKTLNSDPNDNVRLAAVDALAQFHTHPGVLQTLTDALQKEASPAVQTALIDLLLAIQEQRAREALRRFVAKQDLLPPVREYAEQGVRASM